MDENIKVKAKFKGTSRRFEVPYDISWNQLIVQLRQLFEIRNDFLVKYCDDEHELVTVSSQEELNEAIRLHKKTSKLLYLHLEDPLTQLSSDPSLLELEQPNYQNQAKGKKKGTHTSHYSDLASAIADELTALNVSLEKSETLQSSKDEKAGQQKQAKDEDCGPQFSQHTPDMASELCTLNQEKTYPSQKEREAPKSIDESISGEGSKSSLLEAPNSCYIDLEEIMTMSKQMNGIPVFNSMNNSEEHTSDLQRSELGATRGWFGHFEEQQATSNKGKASKKKKRKQNHYSFLAETMSSELGKLHINDKPEETTQSTDNYRNANERNESALRKPIFDQICQLPTESPDCMWQQLHQHQDIPKKLGKKKNCYAELGEEIAPMMAAMNRRLEEQKITENRTQLPDLSDSSCENEVPLCSSSPESSSSEPFVFINEEPLSVQTKSTDIAESQTSSNSCLDVVADGPGPVSSLEQIQQQISEPNHITPVDMIQTPEQGDAEMKKIVKEILKDSMETIVIETVHRLQTPSNKLPAAPCNTPLENVPSGIVVHKGITCDNCRLDVQGIRYKCCNCKDFDLCEACEQLPAIHNIKHVFVKLRYPAPGIGRKHGEMVPIFKKSVYKRNPERRLQEKELRRAAKEFEKERKRAMKEQKHALKVKEKERKRKEKAKKALRTMDKSETTKVQSTHMYERLRAEFVSDANYADGSVVLPGQKFMKSWEVRNSGDIAWNQWITLECIEGSIMGFAIQVPFLKPGDQAMVSVNFVAPEIPGSYSSKWQLSYGLHTFGPYLWCEIQVPESKDEMSVTCDQSTLVDKAFKNDMAAEHVVKLVHEPLLQTTSIDEDSSSEYLSSEEIPEAGSMSLSSSPEEKKEHSLVVTQNGCRQDLEWDAGCLQDVTNIVELSIDDTEHNIRERRNTDNWSFSDDSDGEESDSSLDEFTVLIPPCFDPDAPLTASPYPVVITDVKPNKRRNSFTTTHFSSFESVDPQFEQDDNGPCSLPNMRIVSNEEERLSDVTNPTLNTSEDLVNQDEIPAESLEQRVPTPSGRASPCVSSPNEQVETETPISTQPSVPQDSVPLVTQPTTVSKPRPRTGERDTSDPNNLVSEVLNTAIDAVASAGRAAFATVDNLINGTPQATAVDKPQDDCEVTINRRGPDSEFDAPPPPSLVWPVNRQPSTAMDRLIEMGFCDRKLNERLLRKHNNNIRSTIEELLGHHENDWSSQRH